jgi:toxin ParE1/3/4
MTAKTVIRTHQATQDVERELGNYVIQEGLQQAALAFIAEIEQAYARIGKHPHIGCQRYAYELDIPSLRSWPLDRYPHLIFY